MIPADFHSLHMLLTDEALTLSRAKGAEYASNTDALFNFKDQASSSCSKYDVLRIFLNKHLSSIDKSLRKLALADLACKQQGVIFDPAKTLAYTSEPFRLRIIDAINYLALAEALVAEDRALEDKGPLEEVDEVLLKRVFKDDWKPKFADWEDPDGGK